MTELISNGGFRTALTDWVVSDVDHQEEDGHETVGCAELDSVTGAASLYQNITTATLSGVSEYLAKFLFSFKKTGGEPGVDLVATLGSQTGEIYATITIEHELIPYLDDEWHRYASYVLVPITGALRVTFTAANDASVHLWRISDVSVDEVTPAAAFETGRKMARRLMKLRHDPSAVRHHKERYWGVIWQAQREAPRSMHLRDIDTALVTVADTRRYSMAAITQIEEAWQVRRVFMENSSDGHYYPIGMWHIEDDYGTLYLTLDRTPVEAGLTIKVEYVRIPEETGADEDLVLNQDWLEAKCMTQLLLEADPKGEDPNLLAAQLQMWDAKRQALELKYRHRRKPSKVRSTDWRPFFEGCRGMTFS